MKQTSPYLHKRSRQAGVTLLLAILILSSITAISFSLAAVLLAETRTSGDLIRTEPAIYAGMSITEQGLYNYKRGLGSAAYYSNSIGNVKISNIATSTIDSAVVDVSVPVTPYPGFASSAVYPQLTRLLLWDSAHPSEGGNYGRVKITRLDNGSTNRIQIYICQYKPNSNFDCSNPSISNTNMVVNAAQSAWATLSLPNDCFEFRQGSTLDTGSCAHYQTGMDPSQQQEIILVDQAQGPAQSPAYVQIETFDSNGNPKGIPYTGKISVTATANIGGVSRKVDVVIPNVP